MTWLALAETAIAVSLLVAACRFTGSLWPIAAWSTIGWLFLLRTDASVEAGVKRYKELRIPFRTYVGELSFEPTFNPFVFIGYCLSAASLGLVAILVKCSVTIRFLFGNSKETIAAVPQNWFTSAFCLDVMRPVELVPGYLERLDVEDQDAIDNTSNTSLLAFLVKLVGAIVLVAVYLAVAMRFSGSSPNPISPGGGIGTDVAGPLNVGPILFFLFVLLPLWLGLFALVLVAESLPLVALTCVAVWYRLVLKAVTIVYWPLLYAVWAGHRDSTVATLERICEHPGSKLQRMVALGTLVYVTIEILFAAGVNHFASRFSLALGLAPYESGGAIRVPMWHFAALLNALLAVLLWGYAHERLIHRRPESRAAEARLASERDQHERGVLAVFYWAMGVLSLYTVACTAAMAWKNREFLVSLKVPLGPWFP